MSLLKRVRRSLSEENDFKRYSRYAIGEVVLLVIGVLIALQINNWNQERRNNKIRLEILENLSEEFEMNKEELAFNAEMANGIANSTFILLEMMGPDYERFDPLIVDSLLSVAFLTPNFLPNRGALTDLLNSGKLNYLKSDVLRSYLVSWDAYIDAASEYGNDIEKTMTLIVLPYLFDKVSIRNIDRKYSPGNRALTASPFKVDNRKILNDLSFENMMDDHYYRMTDLIWFYSLLEAEMNDTHDIILEILERDNRKNKAWKLLF